MNQIKVFLYLNDEKPEIRRFGVDNVLVESFQFLKTKLCEVFPILQEKNYTVSWKDEDNDEIIITSDDELKIARMSMDVMKLYVTCKIESEPRSDVPDSGHEKVVHYGVICDGCECVVTGFRYKCTSCIDFDLCSHCEAAGIHSEHCMVRIPTPNLSKDLIRATLKRSRQFMKTVVGNESPHKKNRHERKHYGSGDCRRSTWFETFASYMNEFADLTGDLASAANESQSKSSTPTKNTTENKDETAAEQQVFNLQKKLHDIMEQIGETVANKTPSPSGVKNDEKEKETTGISTESVEISREKITNPTVYDAEASAVTDNLSSGNEPATPNTTPQNSEPSTSKVGNAFDLQKTITSILREMKLTNDSINNKDDKNVNTENVKEGTPLSEGDASIDTNTSTGAQRKGQDKSDGWTMINNDLMDMSPVEASAPPENPQPIGFKDLHHEVEKQLKFENSLYPPLNINAAVFNPRAPEYIPSKATAAPTSSAASSGAVPKTRPTVQPTQAEKPQKENPKPQQPASAAKQLRPHVAHALELMLAMGFSNDGDWLSQLLESKNGNIAAVIDLLTPVRPEKR